MAELPFDTLERQRLCALFAELGPDAPTLLTPWCTRDLAAHLVLREHDHLAAPGLVVPGPWHRFAERRRAKLAERDFASLVRQVNADPPGIFRTDWIRNFPNLNEFFVHHEDVRRANGGGPRANAPDLDAALWRNVNRAAWLLARRLRRGAGLELEWAGTDKRARVRRGEPTARLAGSPGELLLYLFGRRAVAQVVVAGDPSAVAAVHETTFGM